MTLAAAIVAALLLAAPNAHAAPDPATDPHTTVSWSAIMLYSDTVDPALRDELRLRLPELQVLPASARPPKTPHLYVFVDASTHHDHEAGVTVLTSDGRAYDRTMDIDREEPARSLAGAIANLVVSIERDALAPDREGVEIPTQPEEPVVDPPQPDPPPSPKPPPPAPTRPPHWQLGPVGTVGLLVGPGRPEFGDTFAGWGGSLGIDGRGPHGLLLMLDVRGGGRRKSDHRLIRVRFAAGAGYALRVRAFELLAAGALSVEPWFVRRSGSTQDVVRGGRGRQTAPAIGGLLRLSGGYLVTIDSGPLDLLRVGPRLELAGSFAIDNGSAIVPVVSAPNPDGSTDELFRVGAFELEVGLEVGLWFDPRWRRPRAR